MDINDLRSEIDTIDDQIVSLFAQRMEVAAKVADYKKDRNLPVLVPARESEKLQSVTGKASRELSDYVRLLYCVILPLSRAWQHRHSGNTLPFARLKAQVEKLYQASITPNPNEVD